MVQKFRSRISTVILLFVIIPFAVCFFLFLWYVQPLNWGVLVSLVLFLLFSLNMVFNTYYVIHENANLEIVNGFFKTSIPIRDIKSMRATSSKLAAPAASFDRVEITYKKSHIIISPKDKTGFINALLAINPDIENKVSYQE